MRLSKEDFDLSKYPSEEDIKKYSERVKKEDLHTGDLKGDSIWLIYQLILCGFLTCRPHEYRILYLTEHGQQKHIDKDSIDMFRKYLSSKESKKEKKGKWSQQAGARVVVQGALCGPHGHDALSLMVIESLKEQGIAYSICPAKNEAMFAVTAHAAFRAKTISDDWLKEHDACSHKQAFFLHCVEKNKRQFVPANAIHSSLRFWDCMDKKAISRQRVFEWLSCYTPKIVYASKKAKGCAAVITGHTFKGGQAASDQKKQEQKQEQKQNGKSQRKKAKS